MSNRIIINGKSYSGRNITITNGNVLIDGKPGEEGLSGIVEIKVEGDLATLECQESVTVNGNVGKLSAGGSVHCEDVSGNINAGGSIHCGDVGGMVNAGGSVSCKRMK
jgi:hypothetical protein